MEYGSEYDWLANEPFIRDYDTGFVGENWRLYRSGRDALKAFARIAGRNRVLIPALCCESMALPFEQNGYEVEYYKMREDLSADEDDIRAKLSSGCVLLYMRYFGIESLTDTFLQAVRDSGENVLVIEDRTHDILTPRSAEGFKPDATMASLRKWTALPDGAFLVTDLGSCPVKSDGRFAAIRTESMKKKSLYLKNGDKELKKEYMHEMARAALLLDEQAEPVTMGAAEEELLRHIDFEAMMARRVDNALYLQSLLEPLAQQGKLRFMCPCPQDSTLYFTVFLENRDEVHKLLIENAVYAAVIWPLPEKAAECCPVSRYVNQHMLAIPCDHRCSRGDMDFIAAVLRNKLEN